MLTLSRSEIAASWLQGTQLSQPLAARDHSLHVAQDVKQHVVGSDSTHPDYNFNDVLQRVLHKAPHVQPWKMHTVSLTLLLKTHNPSSQQASLPTLTDNLTTLSSQQRMF